VSIRVLIADDQALVRAGFRLVLASFSDLEIIGEAVDGADAVRQVDRLHPDVVLMDIRMPVLDGITATRTITAAGSGHAPRVIILTTYDLDEYVFDALTAGASGFLLKDVPPEELVVGIRVVADGDALLAPSVTRRLIAEFAQGRTRTSPPRVADGSLATLTPREVDVLRLLAAGKSNGEIAQTLVVSENTVKTHVTHILDKLHLRDRVHAVIYAYEAGLVTVGTADGTDPG
jgi:DNA-binding NarL/FixJ family response regulator